MADLQNFTMVRNGSANFNVPVFDVTCDLTDIKDSSIILDNYDGVFPSQAIIQRFTSEEVEMFFREMYTKMIQYKASQI